MYYLISILLGLVPEVLFITLFLSYTKNLKEKRILLFISISIVYFLTMLIQRYILLYYIAFIVSIYIILKIFYKSKTQIIDVFVISISTIYFTVLSLIMMPFINNSYYNYYILLIINRIFLFVPFLFRNKFNILYKNYCKLWNRNDKENRPIKSITLRNISLIIINIFIFIINIATISCLTIFK